MDSDKNDHMITIDERFYTLLAGYINHKPLRIDIKAGQKTSTAYPLEIDKDGKTDVNFSKPQEYTRTITYRLTGIVYDVGKDGFSSEESEYEPIPYSDLVFASTIPGEEYAHVPANIVKAFGYMLAKTNVEVFFDSEKRATTFGTSGEINGVITEFDDERIYLENASGMIRILFKDIIDISPAENLPLEKVQTETTATGN
ncbi:MAG: hypothetical protein QXL94_00435 [Candidatus Parvarchaeum sp.]